MIPYEEGRAAAEAGKTFADDCPYTYDRFGGHVTEFDKQWRWKMDEWFKGWANWLGERDMGFSHEPIRHPAAIAARAEETKEPK